jgi:quinol monooxygenase YgiN
MIKRIVKMSFHPEKVAEFRQIFASSWTKIRDFEGCSHVELLQDQNDPSVFFTYSLWQSEEHVNHYRNSELFKKVWTATRALFKEKAQAWSVAEIRFDQ